MQQKITQKIKINPLGQTLKNAARLRTIVTVFAGHGFYRLAEKVKLGQFVLQRIFPDSDVEKLSTPVRLRMAFEELGPTFVKLGQLLASRPDLVPDEYVQEFSKLHDRVQPLPFETIQALLEEQFGDQLSQTFKNIQPEPLGSASIAQVHLAELQNGAKVVLKIQRPGIIQTIDDDINVLYFLADVLARYSEVIRHFDPKAIVNEFFKTLQLETNFIIEANNIRRFRENFKSEPDIQIPEVYFDLTSEKILVMQALDGMPLSQDKQMSDWDKEKVVKIGLKAFMKMVFQDGLFHGDLHAGNFFVMNQNVESSPTGLVGLVDFGVVGRLNQKTKTAIADMLLALSTEDYERLAYEYVDIAPISEHVDVDLFARELRELVAPYYGLTLKNVNLGKLLMSSSAIAARHGLKVPTELMLYFKAIVNIESIGRRIDKNFDFLQYSIQLAEELIRHQYDPQKLLREVTSLSRDSKKLVSQLPRQLSYFFRKLNTPNQYIKFELLGHEELRRSVETSFNLLFLGFVIGSLIIGSSIILTFSKDISFHGQPLFGVIGIAIALFLSLIAFWNYIRKN
ncbi:MAG: ABC1 kinase family protein [Pseudobdellovibrionaceae bacterium]